MQKQPNLKYPIEYSPLPLADEFPVSSLDDDHYILEEHEITSLHVHDCLEIGCCYDSAGIFIVNDKVLPFRGGDVSVIFKNEFHKAQSEKGNSSQWDFVYISADQLLSDISAQDLSLVVSTLRGCTDFINVLSPDQYPDIAGIIRILSALDYMSKNFMESIQITHAASLCNMSLTNFRRYFNNCGKVSPLQYITKIRIQTASILLTSADYSIVDISSRVGYNSLSSFNRHFKQVQEVSPREWRSGK